MIGGCGTGIMKRLILSLLILPLALPGQELTLAGKSGAKSGWTVKLDPTAFLWVANADGSFTLKVLSGQAPTKKIIGQNLPRAADGTYSIPTGAKNLEIWVNGLHYWETTDFTVSASVLTPKPQAGNWPADADVRLNYEL